MSSHFSISHSTQMRDAALNQADFLCSNFRQKGNLAAAAEVDQLVKIFKEATQGASGPSARSLDEGLKRLGNIHQKVDLPSNQVKYLEKKFQEDILAKMPDYAMLKKHLKLLEESKQEAEFLKSKFKSECGTLQKTNGAENALQMLLTSIKAVYGKIKSPSALVSLAHIATPKKALELLLTDTKRSYPLPFSDMLITEEKGIEREMEDAAIFLEDEKRLLAGIFDGHDCKNDRENVKFIADFVKETFSNQFDAFLLFYKGDVYKAFKELFEQTTNELKETGHYGSSGATAVVTYVDKRSGLAYTAALGNCNVTVYRKIEDSWKAIPLARKLTWANRKEANRAAIFHDAPEFATKWTKRQDDKRLHSSGPQGVYVSRAFGNFEANKKVEFELLSITDSVQDMRALATTQESSGKEVKESIPLISHEPEISINQMQEGDVLLLSSHEFDLQEQEITSIIEKSGQSIKSIIISLIKALKADSGRGNTTLMCVKIPEKK